MLVVSLVDPSQYDYHQVYKLINASTTKLVPSSHDHRFVEPQSSKTPVCYWAHEDIIKPQNGNTDSDKFGSKPMSMGAKLV